MLLAPTTRTITSTPQSCFFAEYKGTSLLRTGQGNLGTPNALICADSAADRDAEVARLGLTPPKSKGEQAADYFRTLDPVTQAKFYSVFVALSALTDDAQKVLGIQAVATDTDAEAAAKAQLLAIFAGA